ncbi:MAG: hypothetical protein Q7T20_16740 [Saprospiraceae bacterium]|nr:hypothetical protein [Saprospiraceae bacterium]
MLNTSAQHSQTMPTRLVLSTPGYPRFTERPGEHLAEKMLSIAQSIEGLKDTLHFLTPQLGTDFAQIALFNTQLENFTLLLNLANLRYRIALPAT